MAINNKNNDKICKFCKKEFHRKWNKERHEKDIHKVYTNLKNEKNYQENSNQFDCLRNNSDINNEFYNKNDNNNIKWMNNNESYSYPFYNHYYYYYNNNSPYPIYPYPNFIYQNINSHPKLEKKVWTQNDHIKMQKALRILQKYLLKIYDPNYTYRLIKRLHDRCSSEKSIEPLKQFFVRKYLGHLWPYDD
jgi:hypothetical protein